jgi:hypothetical protein
MDTYILISLYSDKKSEKISMRSIHGKTVDMSLDFHLIKMQF